jgi:hypothetical protein
MNKEKFKEILYKLDVGFDIVDIVEQPTRGKHYSITARFNETPYSDVHKFVVLNSDKQIKIFYEDRKLYTFSYNDNKSENKEAWKKTALAIYEVMLSQFLKSAAAAINHERS